ncbi:hypothetical protein C3942_11060 [Solimonas fluminis]|uniref:DUF4124 domain-containing protein n=1 Tax=Solimonas fluminis TaxID=2086571 RepID=A0A2S5TG51_9GAMM|nr:hypothetical protein [Solimonas fluminis]PPE73929.1 hypothetical protein C3942_11060 [Solimonas fluminis]
MIKTTAPLLAAALLAALSLPVQSATEPTKPAKAQAKSGTYGKIQCWTDDQGNRACGDRVPPEYASKELETVDRQGRVVNTRSREKTAEEIAAEEKAAAEAAAAKVKAEKQAAYDKFLTDSYSSVKDLERARNERLATLDGRVNLANQSIEGSEASKADLQKRIDGMLKKGRPAAEQQKQLRDVEKALRDNRAAIAQMQKDRESVCSDFLRDIQRYQELKMGAAAYAGECPKPGSPVLAAVIEKPLPAAPKKKTDQDKKKDKKKDAKKDKKNKDAKKDKKPEE